MARRKLVKSCRKCGRTPLYWGNFDGSWVLAEVGGERHTCNAADVAANPNLQEPPREFPKAVENLEAYVQADAPINPPVVYNPADNGNGDAGRTLYQLVKPHANADLRSIVNSALEGFNPSETLIAKLRQIAAESQPAPIIVTLPGKNEAVAHIERPHKQTATLIRYSTLGLHVLLVGPAGSGKTHAAEQAAEALGVKFYPQSVGAQTSKSDLLGYIDAHGKPVRTILREAYEHGGVFLLDEVDAGNANVLTILNAALANKKCSFPDAVVEMHPDFRCIAAANTYGNGASRQYVGRNQLDAATLNRFVIIDWEYDETLESNLGQADWVSYIHSLRRAQQSTGVRVIISTRAIVYGNLMLTSGITRSEVEQAVIWAGVSQDDRSKLQAAAR